jgi:hypothetical protein
MTYTDDTGDTAPATVDEAREQVEQTRSDLTETLEGLTDKLDVKKQAKAKAHDLSGKVHESAAAISHSAGNARDAMPVAVRHGIDSTAQQVRPAISTVVTQAKSHRRPLLLVGIGGLLAVVAARRWRRSRSSGRDVSRSVDGPMCAVLGDHPRLAYAGICPMRRPRSSTAFYRGGRLIR